MRYALLLLCSVLIGGTYAVAQAAPASPAASKSKTASQPATVAAPAPPAHPMTNAQVEEMLKVTDADRMQKQLLTEMMFYVRHKMPPYMPKDVITDLETSLESTKIDDVVMKIYQKHISEQDAAAIIAFDKTPAGQHLIAVMPEIQKETLLASEQAARQVVTRVFESHQAEIQAAAKKYAEEHSSSSSGSPK